MCDVQCAAMCIRRNPKDGVRGVNVRVSRIEPTGSKREAAGVSRGHVALAPLGHWLASTTSSKHLLRIESAIAALAALGDLWSNASLTLELLSIYSFM